MQPNGCLSTHLPVSAVSRPKVSRAAELIACAAAPTDGTSDQAPDWLMGGRDSDGIRERSEGGLVP
jgi:hypothetical protein